MNDWVESFFQRWHSFFPPLRIISHVYWCVAILLFRPWKNLLLSLRRYIYISKYWSCLERRRRRKCRGFSLYGGRRRTTTGHGRKCVSFFLREPGVPILSWRMAATSRSLNKLESPLFFFLSFFPFNQFLLFITFGAYAKLFQRRRRRSGGMKEAKVKSSHSLRARQQSSSSCTAFACVCVCLSYQ